MAYGSYLAGYGPNAPTPVAVTRTYRWPVAARVYRWPAEDRVAR